MKRLQRHWRWWAIAAVMVVAAILASQFLRPLRDAAGFDVPTARDAAKARTAFAQALDGHDAVPAGLEATRFLDRPGVIGLREGAGDCRGRGAYMLRAGDARPLALVAPHRRSDRNTGTLAGLLFAEHRVAAAAWSSAPRRKGEGCSGGDPARHFTHYLTAFSLAFADAHPQGRIVQLHGFERTRRASSAAQLADIIVSDGTRTPGRRIFDLADCLSRSLAPMPVAVFPNDVAELGALTNRQGQALRSEGFDGFVHLEMSAQLRASLVQDPELRNALASCLMTGLG